MNVIVDSQREPLSAICRRFRVGRLELFGSAADGTFDPDSSDLDFLVEFVPLQRGEYYDAFFGLLESLEALFGRRVDLVDVECLHNPYFVRRVNESRKGVYDARSQEVSG